MVGGAVKAEVDAKRDRGPGRVLRAAVEAYLEETSPVLALGGVVFFWGSASAMTCLVGRLRLEFLKDLERLLLRGEGAHGDG